MQFYVYVHTSFVLQKNLHNEKLKIITKTNAVSIKYEGSSVLKAVLHRQIIKAAFYAASRSLFCYDTHIILVE